jgi:hypothetical protein
MGLLNIVEDGVKAEKEVLEGDVTNITNDIPNNTNEVGQRTEDLHSDEEMTQHQSNSEYQSENESLSDNYGNQENSSESNYDPQLINNQQDVGTRNVSEIKNSDGLIEVVKSMRDKKPTEAAENMLWDFDEMQDGHRYFEARNGENQYGLMSIKPPPKLKEGEEVTENSSKIDDSLWVEGLVADSKSGLGSELLAHAEEIARKEEKKGTALAAYECDLNPDPKYPDFVNDPYSVTGYYEKKGYSYSGEAKEELGEVDGEKNSYFYPIYHKDFNNDSTEPDTHNLADETNNELSNKDDADS